MTADLDLPWPWRLLTDDTPPPGIAQAPPGARPPAGYMRYAQSVVSWARVPEGTPDREAAVEDIERLARRWGHLLTGPRTSGHV